MTNFEPYGSQHERNALRAHVRALEAGDIDHFGLRAPTRASLGRGYRIAMALVWATAAALLVGRAVLFGPAAPERSGSVPQIAPLQSGR